MTPRSELIRLHGAHGEYVPALIRPSVGEGTSASVVPHENGLGLLEGGTGDSRCGAAR